MAINYTLDRLDLEMTRKCSAYCQHCMRGNAQNLDMKPSTIKNIFENEDHHLVAIQSVLITGGDPMLNKEGLKYFLSYILNNNIIVNHITMIINALTYDQEIMNLFVLLEKRGTEICLQTVLDQFHPRIPQENISKFKKYSFYSLIEENLEPEEIVNFGRAQENNLGNEYTTIRALFNFKMKNDCICIYDIKDNLVGIKSLYVTANGRFGEATGDCSWDMVDDKYHLDITKDSLFTNCLFETIYQNYFNDLKSGKILLPDINYQRDFHQAQEDNCLDIFLNSITEESLRNYLVNNANLYYTRNLKN